MQQQAGVVDHVIPLKRWAGIVFVGLNMVMAKDAVVRCQIVIRQFLGNHFALGVVWIIASDFGKDFCEGGRELDEGVVLLRREIVLIKLVALHGAFDQFIARGVADKVFRANPAVSEFFGYGDSDFDLGPLL